MKRSSMTLPSRIDGLDIFAGESLEIYDDLVQRAQDKIRELKHTYRNKNLFFEYGNETIRGRFVTAVEGDFPGTYMIVLKIASSRICSGPSFLHLHGQRVGAIVVTGKHGLVGITAKAMPEEKKAVLHISYSDFAQSA